MKKTFSIKKHRVILSACVSVFIIMFVFVFISRDKMTTNVSRSELAYTDISPLGTSGGSVMPASCDSYPDHSTCQCTLGQTTTVGCVITNGTGSQTNTCVASGDNMVWGNNGACVITGCNAGYDYTSGATVPACTPSCTGNQYRTYTTTNRNVCISWAPSIPKCGSIMMKEDPKSFASLLAPEKAHALVCCDREIQTITVAGCSACPNGQVPNSDHTSCVTVAVPAVNVHF